MATRLPNRQLGFASRAVISAITSYIATRRALVALLFVLLRLAIGRARDLDSIWPGPARCAAKAAVVTLKTRF